MIVAAVLAFLGKRLMFFHAAFLLGEEFKWQFCLMCWLH
jgi:hypothetical protein